MIADEDLHARQHAVAEMLAERFQHGERTFRPEKAMFPNCLSDAYAIQDLVASRIDWPVVGWKAAFTAKELMAARGLDSPAFGRIYQSCLHADGATLSRRTDMLAVEAEFAFRLVGDIAPHQTISREALSEMIDSMSLAIEIVGSRISGDVETTALMTIADNSNGCAVVERAVDREAWQGMDLTKLSVTMLADGVEVANGSGERVLGDPMVALHWLVNAIGAAGHGISSSDILITGTCLGAPRIEQAREFEARFDSLGSVCFSLA